MASTVVFAFTGELGVSREELIQKMSQFGASVVNDISKKTAAVIVGDNPKTGKLMAAQLNNVPRLSATFVDDMLKSDRLPSFDKYLLASQQPADDAMPSSRTRRHSLEGSAPSLSEPSSRHKKRPHSSITGDLPQSVVHTVEVTRPSKKAKLQRSISTSTVVQTTTVTTTTTTTAASPAAPSTPVKKVPHDSSHIMYASEEAPGAVIALEGLIGIGKSTLCNKLLQLYPDNVDVYREETNEKFLQLFYSDPKRYGFALQWGMLKSRIYQLRLAQHDTRHGRWPHRELLFWDRSMIGDYTFALWNHLLGGISKQEMEAYESEFGGSIRNMSAIAFLRDINLFVLMNDEPARCKTRVEVNRKNASEQGIPLPYYEGLDDIHYHVFIEMLRHRVAKVLVQPWGEYDNPETCKALYENALQGIIEGPKVTDEPAGALSEMATSASSSIVYRSEEDIVKQYQLLSSDNAFATVDELKAFSDVYVPRNLMQIDPAVKEVNAEHLAPYNITFYQNAYKRVVLFHLGNNQHVHFYDSL